VSQIASEALIERLADWGVDTVFGLPGDGINGIMEGLRRHQDRVRFVLVHHEEAAAFMATAHAKATGRIGVCLATSGPGGIHLLNGLYDAKLDHMPVLAITGMQETSVLGTGYQQEVNLDKLYADVAEYDQMIYNPAQLPSVVDNAIRTAYARRGVAHLTVPNDIQVADADADPWQHVAPARPPSTAPVMLEAPGRPSEQDLQRIADLLNEGDKVAILAGAGARHAREELLALAETIGAPIVKTLSGKATVPDDSPYTTGGIGLLGTRPSEDLMEQIDTLLMVGTNFPYTKHLPAPSKVRVAQIEADPARAGGRIPTEVPVVGDAKLALQGLLPLVKQRTDTAFLGKCQDAMTKWRKNMASQADAERDPIAPQYLVSVLNELATEDAVLTCDSGTIATWAARHWDVRGGREFFLSGNLATMAPGMPYAIGIQHAFPGRQVIAFVGDGGFAMLMAEFLTAIKHGLPVKVVINNNNSLGQILWEQMVLGYPEYGVRHSDPFVDYAAFATANGALGLKVERAAGVRAAIEQALSHDGPALVDVNVNPDEPPLPGKVEREQAIKFAQAFLRGQPRKATIATTLFRDKIEQLKG
jgi:pyruvate dehydrogenase (quinone)/pyruvate oxidase